MLLKSPALRLSRKYKEANDDHHDFEMTNQSLSKQLEITLDGGPTNVNKRGEGVENIGTLLREIVLKRGKLNKAELEL